MFPLTKLVPHSPIQRSTFLKSNAALATYHTIAHVLIRTHTVFIILLRHSVLCQRFPAAIILYVVNNSQRTLNTEHFDFQLPDTIIPLVSVVVISIQPISTRRSTSRNITSNNLTYQPTSNPTVDQIRHTKSNMP